MALMAERAGDILAISSFYDTEPWGFESPNRFLNAAVRLETALSPFDLLAVARQIESELGRTHTPAAGGASYRDRTIDIDILLYDDLILDSETLTLPHPLMHRRLFVVQPLAEIAPQLRHPALKCSMAELLGRLR
jgi:2-amino-4-hydroxy-6-hydroxymethyldihydropteridine diphosphokinase